MHATFPPSQAKNLIRRTLRAILDPHPNKKELARVQEHFRSCCAFCGVRVGQAQKDGHLDHLEAGGSNHISNRVLSCANCNEKEKLDRPWRDFLREKANSPEEYAERETRILEWVESAQVSGAGVPEEAAQQVEEEIRCVLQRYNEAVQRIRDLGETLAQQVRIEK